MVRDSWRVELPAPQRRPANRPRLGRGPPIAAPSPCALIGCTRYFHFDEKKWLAGPANDVQLMRNLLVERLGCLPEQVVVLAGNDSTSDFCPTKANIHRELKELAAIAQTGDEVFVHYAGYGGKLPDDGPDEPDGLDEALFPADTMPYDPDSKSVGNAIRDDELGAWLGAIAIVRRMCG